MLVYIVRSERMRARSIREEHSVAIQANPAPTRDEPTRLSRVASPSPRKNPLPRNRERCAQRGAPPQSHISSSALRSSLTFAIIRLDARPSVSVSVLAVSAALAAIATCLRNSSALIPATRSSNARSAFVS